MEMRKCRLGVVIYFSRGVSTLVHRKYTEKNALLKLCDIGKSGKQVFFLFWPCVDFRTWKGVP